MSKKDFISSDDYISPLMTDLTEFLSSYETKIVDDNQPLANAGLEDALKSKVRVLTDYIIHGINFSWSDIHGVCAYFSDVEIRFSNLAHVTLDGWSIDRLILKRCDVTGMKITNSNIKEIIIENCVGTSQIINHTGTVIGNAYLMARESGIAATAGGGMFYPVTKDMPVTPENAAKHLVKWHKTVSEAMIDAGKTFVAISSAGQYENAVRFMRTFMEEIERYHKALDAGWDENE